MANAGEWKNNPYIIGNAIDEEEKFFGRRSLFDIIEDNLNQDVKIIVLHGQRRIGKSSVLRLMHKFLRANDWRFVICDLQDKSTKTLGTILNSLAKEIIEHLELNDLREPNIEKLDKDPTIFGRRFLPRVYRRLENKKLVLLLDEFDVVIEQANSDRERLPLLNELLKKQERLFIIPVVGRHPSTLQQLKSLFKNAPYQKIGLLDNDSARRLITKPAIGSLEYEEDAIDRIISLSAGHPYFIQVICFTIFTQAKNKNNRKITSQDVEEIIDEAIDKAEAGLAWFWQGLPMVEQVVFLSVAESKEIAKKHQKTLPDKPLELLRHYGISQTDEIDQAVEQLFEKGLLDETKRQVKIEFVRLWLLKKHTLNEESDNIKKLQINSKFTQASNLDQQGSQDEAVKLYGQILELDSNHVSTLLALTDIYLNRENLDKAVEFAKRAYNVDPTSSQEKLLDALERYGDRLKQQRKFEKAKQQYQKILEIKPDQILIRGKLQSLEDEIASTSSLLAESRKKIALAGAGVSFLFLCVIFGSCYKSSIDNIPKIPTQTPTAIPPNSPDIKNYISRGERALFFSDRNNARDEGIKAFNARNYSKAAEWFKIAVTENRNDPEVLIYYNNALARQQGYPNTLAAVVPVENAKDKAQEILRGVAQAQNEFNANGGLNGRLLEIVIANDANGKMSEQVASSLAQDSSILGVIGHYTSDSTEKALPIYQKPNPALPVISPTSSSTKLKSDVFFRATASDREVGKQLAEYAWNNGLKKVVIFWNPNSIFSLSLKEQFITNFEQLGGIIVGNPIDLAAGSLDAEKEVRDSISQQAQAAVLIPDSNHVAVAEQIVRANANLKPSPQRLKLLSSDVLYVDKFSKVTAFEGLILSVPWFREAPQSKRFAQAGKRQWGGDISSNTAASYDVTQAFIKALSTNPSRSTILQKLPQVNLSSGETSGDKLEFQDHERQSQPILIQVQQGQFKFLK
ncbi:ABC transporter substrate-binding protein [Calothrix sp. FACHB-1219]|uniref:ABC transporter substrate-binding protein n=1 Tax=unclassified Calothrix TaxID=2619626 RepID=UPI0016835BFE|nr:MULTISPECIES: ABC transporter substrate-binding protein [unclassified Calothrix]MBD2203087.1 ABC transporter substrate-binding protein [Calothrix sp. FACHB-168]MBD2218688.1 ABC transporter substrate-binding protein [Calothrix sp. FACHB-1219]